MAAITVVVLSFAAFQWGDARAGGGRDATDESFRVEMAPPDADFNYTFQTLAFSDVSGPYHRHAAHVESDGQSAVVVRPIEQWHFFDGRSGDMVCAIGEGGALDLRDECPPGSEVAEISEDASGEIPGMFVARYGTASPEAVERAPLARGTAWEPYIGGLGLDPSEVAVVSNSGMKTCSEWGYECDDDGPHEWSITRLVHLGSKTMLRELETLGDTVLTDYEVQSITPRMESQDGD